MYRQLAMLLLAMASWFLVGGPIASWLAWHSAEQHIAALEAKAQRDEKISALALCQSVRQLEVEAAAREKAITAFGGIGLGFLMGVGGLLWQRRAEAKARARADAAES